MSHDTLLDLSRWQWALTAAFHITFPALTVGTSVFLAYGSEARRPNGPLVAPDWRRSQSGTPCKFARMVGMWSPASSFETKEWGVPARSATSCSVRSSS